MIQQVPGVPSLFVLPVGITPPNPLELVERPAFGLLMRELAAKFDHVVVDTPAAIYGADAAVIAARCGAALVIARKDASRVGMLQDLVASFAGSPAKLAGVVVTSSDEGQAGTNHAPERIPDRADREHRLSRARGMKWKPLVKHFRYSAARSPFGLPAGFAARRVEAIVLPAADEGAGGRPRQRRPAPGLAGTLIRDDLIEAAVTPDEWDALK